jgi:hypothetical protein
MVVIERELSGFTLPQAPTPGSRIRSFTLVSGPEAVYPGFQYTLSFPLPNALKVLLTGPDRPLPPHDNVDAVISAQQYEFVVVQVDARACSAVLAFPPIAEGDTDLDGARRRREVRVQWSDCIILEIWEQTGSSGAEADGTRGSAGGSTGWERISSDLPSRSYALTERGMMRHWRLERDSIHLGLGEKAAPLNLTGRSFSISGTDAACYDAFGGDPLYKHTPFLVITPRSVDYQPRRSTYALYHPSNANATWDIGRLHDDPWGYFKTFTQDWGGIEEWYLLGKGVQQVTRTWAELVGRPRLVGRDWLGYLASGMGLGESVSAQVKCSGATGGVDQ